MVEKLGHFPVKAGDGQQALELADHYVPDAFVIDLQMPKINGLEVLKALRNDDRFRESPIIVLTSLRDEEMVRLSINQRATAYVLKDDPVAIMKRLRCHLAMAFCFSSVDTL